MTPRTVRPYRRITASLSMLAALAAPAAPLSISNDHLAVTYDQATRAFAVAAAPDAAPFLVDGRLEDAAAGAREQPAQDAVFGAGKRITVPLAGGGGAALEVYPGLPFLVVRTTRANPGAEELVLNKAVPAAFTLDLGKPAADLRTMGTAGLTAPDKHPGSYLFLTLADPATRRGVVAGWLTHERGSGVVFSGVQDGRVAFRAQIDYGALRIPAGKSAALETLLVGGFADARLGEEAFADALAKQYAIKLRPQVNGYCTWYSDRHGGAGDEKSILELSEVAARDLKPYGFSFVQIDDKWQDGGDYNGPRRGFDRVKPNGPYPGGMKPVADRIKELGLTAGIWFMPFARNHQDPEYQDRQHWFMKRLDGKPYETAWGGTSLDLTLPEVREHVTRLVKLIHSWGYDYFKMDGLWTGSCTEQIYVNDGYRDDKIGTHQPFHDRFATNIEAYRSGLKLIREAVGPDVFFSGCNVSQNMRSLGGSIGLVDSMRIGPDNGTGWNDLIVGPVRGTRLYFLHGRVWWNDPDPSYVRASVPLHHARFITSWVAVSGTFNLNSDWIPGLPPERIDVMRRTMPAHGAQARPVDYFDTPMPRIWHVSDARSGVDRHVLGLFNWESTDTVISDSAARAGLDPAKTWHAFDFWDNRLVSSISGDFNLDVPGQSCRVLALRASEGRPLLLSTSRHVTQGVIDVKKEQWAGDTLSGVSTVVANDPYELRIGGTCDGGREWVPAEVTVSEADRAAGVTVSHAAAPGLVRVLITSPTGRDVAWSVRFTHGPLTSRPVTGLTATAGSSYDPVALSWQGGSVFHTIARDRLVIARGVAGTTYVDRTAPRGKTLSYTVTPDGGVAGGPALVTVPAEDPPAPMPQVRLTSLKPVSVKVGWGDLKTGASADGRPLTVGRKVVADGLGMHANGEVVYERKPEWKRFVATVGLNESQRVQAAASVNFRVVAETAAGARTVLVTTPVLRYDGLESAPINVALPPDAVRIRLEVLDGGDGIRCDHANWGDPGFVTE